MAQAAYVFGGIVQYDEPRWEPLERAVGEELMEWFMWMFEVQTTAYRRFQAYKHQATRRYLHVDHQGRAYAFRGERSGRDRYEEIALADAIELALCSWKYLGATADDLALVDAAIARAREGASGGSGDAGEAEGAEGAEAEGAQGAESGKAEE
jgi:hypothetical protein